MNKKISEIRLKDCLEGLKKGLQDQISKESAEQTNQLKTLENKHFNKISDLEDEFQIEIGENSWTQTQRFPSCISLYTYRLRRSIINQIKITELDTAFIIWFEFKTN